MNSRDTKIIIRYVEDGLSTREVGDEFGLTRERVRQILVDSGITRRHGGERRRVQDDDRIRAAFDRITEDGSTTKIEAEILGVRSGSLRARFRRMGLRLPLAVARHGTRHYYMKYKCRCVPCRAAASAHGRSLKQREPPEHGTASAYHNYGCRCVPCRAAGREARRVQKRRRLERNEALLHGLHPRG